MRAYRPQVLLIPVISEDGKEASALVITQGYDDGRIMQQFGEGENWVQIKVPDEMAVMVGACKYCQKPIFEDDEWYYSEQQGTKWHMFEEDCDTALLSGETVLLKKADCKGKCRKCDTYILPDQEVQVTELGTLHALSEDCQK